MEVPKRLVQTGLNLQMVGAHLG